MSGIRTLTDVINHCPDRFRGEADALVGGAVERLADGDSGVDAVTITVTFKFERGGRQVEVTPSAKSTEKRSPYVPVAFYVNKDGVLVEEDPAQQKLPHMQVVGIGNKERN